MTHIKEPRLPSDSSEKTTNLVDIVSEPKSPETIAAERLCHIATSFLEVADRISTREPAIEVITEVRIPEVTLGYRLAAELEVFPAFSNYPLETKVVYRRPVGDRPDLALRIQAVDDKGIVVANMEVSRSGLSAHDTPFETLISAHKADGQPVAGLRGMTPPEDINGILANALRQRIVNIDSEGANQAESNENLPDFQDPIITEDIQEIMLARWPNLARTATTHIIELDDGSYRMRIFADEGFNSEICVEKLGQLLIGEDGKLNYAVLWAAEIRASSLMTCLNFPKETSSDVGEQEYNILKTLELLARFQSRYGINI